MYKSWPEGEDKQTCCRTTTDLIKDDGIGHEDCPQRMARAMHALWMHLRVNHVVQCSAVPYQGCMQGTLWMHLLLTTNGSCAPFSPRTRITNNCMRRVIASFQLPRRQPSTSGIDARLESYAVCTVVLYIVRHRTQHAQALDIGLGLGLGSRLCATTRLLLRTFI